MNIFGSTSFQTIGIFLIHVVHSDPVVVIKDSVLPMILSGLTMNFMLYEKDYGLAIARLHCHFK